MRKLTIQQFEDSINAIHQKEKLKVLEFSTTSEPAKVQCLQCGTVYNKNRANQFTDKRKISICKKCYPTHENTLKKFILPEGYCYIDDYRGMQNKVRIKHECGFIWEITPANIKLGKGCPKCNKRISKGEQKIISYLNDKNITYIHQYKIDIQDHHLSIDFYLPKKDLYIEYNGEQHYQPINFFGGVEKFQQQIRLDNLKKDFLRNKLLVIPYTEYSNIDAILENYLKP